MAGLLSGFPAIIGAVTSPIGLVALGLLLVASLAILMTDKLASGARAGVFLVILFCFVLVLLVLRPTGSVGGGGGEGLTGGGSGVSGGGSGSGGKQAPTDSSLPAAGDYILPNSATDPIDPATLAGFSALKLKLARNEIYARHGLIFTSVDTKGYFETRSWYRPTATSVELSPIEQRNVLAIKQVEAGRG